MGASQHGCARRGCGDRSGGAGGVGGRGADPFIGDANLAEAEVVAVSGELATVRIGPLTRKLPHHGLAPGPARVALRPETIELMPEQRADALAGEILKATYLGNHMEYTVTTALGELFVVDPHVDRPLAPGTAVAVLPRARGLTLVRE